MRVLLKKVPFWRNVGLRIRIQWIRQIFEIGPDFYKERIWIFFFRCKRQYDFTEYAFSVKSVTGLIFFEIWVVLVISVEQDLEPGSVDKNITGYYNVYVITECCATASPSGGGSHRRRGQSFTGTGYPLYCVHIVSTVMLLFTLLLNIVTNPFEWKKYTSTIWIR